MIKVTCILLIQMVAVGCSENKLPNERSENKKEDTMSSVTKTTLIDLSKTDNREYRRVNIEIIDCKEELTLPLNSSDTSQIGYIEEEYVDGTLGPTAMVVDDVEVFLVDKHFAKIRKIDLNTGLMETGKHNFKISQPWLQDITVFKGLIAVTSDLGVVYFFSKDLKYLYEREIKRDNLFFLGNNPDSLKVYLNNSGVIVALDKEGNILNEKKERLNIWKKEIHLFSYNELVSFDSSDSKNKILETIPLIKEYNAKNYSLTENGLHYFDLLEDSIIRFYSCKW